MQSEYEYPDQERPADHSPRASGATTAKAASRAGVGGVLKWTCRVTASTAIVLAMLEAGNAAAQALPESAGFGASPVLPRPDKQWIPTVNVAEATGWPQGGKPVAAPGLQVQAFASQLDHPRWVYVLPNGDVLVAESNKPPPDENEKPSLRRKIMGFFMKSAGAGVPSANRITLLRDANGDGVVETRTVFLKDLNSPFGMALVGNQLYVANTDAVVRFPYTEGATSITAAPTKVVDLPAKPLNHHWTKNIIASRDGKKLYATVGSNSNVGENGMNIEEGRAAIHEIDLASGKMRLFASGLRNPNGLAWQPQSGALWTTVNERDEIGDDLVPDYMTSVRDGGFYGWPYSYFGQHVDERIEPPRPDLVAKAIVPDYALGAHTASLGLAFYEASLLPAQYRNGAFVGQHGSWNRKPRSGYKLVFVPFTDGKPSGPPQDILSGFVVDDKALGRPVGVAVDKAGAVLMADDVGNIIWRVTPAK
ncbi:PQQ-dependent sugar dehydrogenase [Uliginosibacterium sp. H1]|uniref:PQQ-dependent sugar dehydrogenase n=1 Tax=Uliginosibacterium sp. H1 TaxID=3114757 RepID=UPI002E1773F8|nr:sorbosone dehydrogenase family protein [Uliginosibacterium sp. H1]